MRLFILLFIVPILVFSVAAFGQEAEPWEAAYVGADATGDHIIGFWNFEGAGETVVDASGQGHDGTLAGAARVAEGRFGAGVQSFRGWPVEDERHAVRVPDAPELSPRGAFTVEMWIRPAAELADYPAAFLVDKKYVADDDFQWILDAPGRGGAARHMKVVLGFGGYSETFWTDEAVEYEPGTWYHVAFTYDGAGTVEFLRDGKTLGATTKAGLGPVHPGGHVLSIGDRVGSYYHGFPGTIDEVRLTAGAREFRPLVVSAAHVRTAYERMEGDATLRFAVANARAVALSDVAVTVGVRGGAGQDYTLSALAPEAVEEVAYTLDTSLRPGAYDVEVAYRVNLGGRVYENEETFPATIVGRRLPHRMPVVMWGLYGVENVAENLGRLKELGFTHSLGLRTDYGAIWEAGEPVPVQDEAGLAAGYAMLDRAFAEGVGVIASMGVGRWLESKPELLRVNRAGEPYERENVCCLTPGLLEFSRNAGASMAQSYGDFPAFEGALINTEVRDGSQVCFHDHDRAAYRAASGADIPGAVRVKNGVPYGDLPDFPADRVVPDDHDLLQFYRWFWKEGDGWNAMHTAVHEGLMSAGRDDLWTFFDPAVRVPAIWGSGGAVDYLSHWTYSYPDPLRIGLATDELLAMAQGGPARQDVMKMTQIIWYRSQTAPADAEADGAVQSAWEDYDPDAAYITIAPAHLREAFWSKIARPVKGIMYHGWQSLVPTEGTSTYRYTHPETRYALEELVETVVQPIGPTLVQVPAAAADVAFLESFASEMFARRGTYGWGRSWAGDAYHIVRYAGLQPDVVFEETIRERGLDGYRVLVMPDCDVLPESVVAAVQAFQQGGGIVVGDARLCPAITPDITMAVYERTKDAQADKAALIARAGTLREALAGRYTRAVESSVPDVLTYRRRYGTSDYVFVINDRREYGSYVGGHGRVMENGLPARATVTLERPGVSVYDLVAQRAVPVTEKEGKSTVDVQLEPAGGRLYLVTGQPIAGIDVAGPEVVAPGATAAFDVAVRGADGAPVDAVVPVTVDIRDPDGRRAEYSGHYGAKDGTLRLELDLATNDRAGMWRIGVRNGATGERAWHFFRLRG